MAKRIMHSFKMHEISAVTRPAQEHARMAIMKRAEAGDEYWKRDFTSDQRQHAADSGKALPDGSFPIVTTADLSNAIHAIGRAKDPAKAKAHIIARAKALGATNALPDGWVSKSGVPEMDPKELQKMIDDAIVKANAPLLAQLATATATIDTLTKAAKKKTPPSADDGDEPDADDASKSLWRPYVARKIAKAVEATKAEIAEIAKGDEVITVGETTIRKSVVGEATFAAMKAQQAQIAVGIEKAEVADFTKIAETTYGHLTGEPVAKGNALRSLSKLEKADCETIVAMLKGGEKAMKDALTVKGQDGSRPGDGSAQGELDKMVDDYMAKNAGKSRFEAMDAVSKTAEGKSLYTKSIDEKKRAA